MGKVRRNRQKYHLAASSGKKNNNEVKSEAMEGDAIPPDRLQNMVRVSSYDHVIFNIQVLMVL